MMGQQRFRTSSESPLTQNSHHVSFGQPRNTRVYINRSGPSGRSDNRPTRRSSRGFIALPTITFRCDRGIPDASHVPILAALGVALLGFEAAYVRCEAYPPHKDNTMPDFPDDVDAVRVASHRRFDAWSGDSVPPSNPYRQEGTGSPPNVVVLLDLPLTANNGPSSFGAPAGIHVVTRSLSLDRGLVPSGVGFTYWSCDGLERGSTRRRWDDLLNGWRLTAPSVGVAEFQSLLSCVPMFRVRTAAMQVASEILGERRGRNRQTIGSSSSRRIPRAPSRSVASSIR